MKFADESDRASHLEELEREYQLTAIRSKASQRLQPCGSCHYCESDVSYGLLFCDDYCRDYWQQHQEAQLRNGRL